MKRIETMSLDSAMKLINSYGLSMSFTRITALIDARAVPWAICGMSSDGHMQRIVFRKRLVEWLEELAEEPEK